MRVPSLPIWIVVAFPLALPILAADLADYEQGLAACRSGRYAEARQLLSRFLGSSPPADLADNALYWYGEAYYAEGRYAEAAERFAELTRLHPRENKAPDGWLKLAFCREKLGDVGGAMEALREAWRLGGATEVGRKAQERLQLLREQPAATPSAPPPAAPAAPRPTTAARIEPPAAPLSTPPPVSGDPEPTAPAASPIARPEPAPAPSPSPSPSPEPPPAVVTPEVPLYWPPEPPSSPDRFFVAGAKLLYAEDVWGFAVSPDGREVFVYDNARVNIATQERSVKEGILLSIDDPSPRPGRPPAWFASAVKLDVFEGPKKPSEKSYGPDGVTYAYSKYYSRIRNVVLGRQGVEHVLSAGNLPFWLPDGRLLVVGYGRDGNDSLTEGLTLLELGVR